MWCVEVLRASLPANLPRLDDDRGQLPRAPRRGDRRHGRDDRHHSDLAVVAVGARRVAPRIRPIGRRRRVASARARRRSSSRRSRSPCNSARRIGAVHLELRPADARGPGLRRRQRAVGRPGVAQADRRRHAAHERDRHRGGRGRCGACPGSKSVALAWGTQPLVTGDDRTTRHGARSDRRSTSQTTTRTRSTSRRSYFNVLRVPLVARPDVHTMPTSRPGAPPSVILNDIAAARYFGADESASGRWSSPRAAASSSASSGRSRLQGPEADMRPEVYVPLNWQHAFGSPLVTLMMRTTRDPAVRSPPSARRSTRPRRIWSSPDLQTYDERFDRHCRAAQVQHDCSRAVRPAGHRHRRRRHLRGDGVHGRAAHAGDRRAHGARRRAVARAGDGARRGRPCT